ncbi:MAG: TonB-dependent receptor [Phenylobacterium sp.]|uniref:TonB-dependent receptor plug domain-containing protein n=1 Tax=Phenylobacterium sp. TaxID=1871053 RepID=UPI001A3CCCF4|nr:TonB-dependent receptor [Phenylobacterium sp.]MBL8771597.1 TonB-dependent receptor [Phenylobacterium sp.]
MDVGEIVVTGSRIARPNLDAPTPVSVIDTRTIEARGAINTGDVIRTLPAAGVSSITPTNSGFQTAANGITTVDLRNLGEDRTLVLVNGRRFVAGLVGTQVVDFNTIPTELVDRVDVVTGGASATYGSDALAGVVNIITKRNIDGVIVAGQYGLSEREDDERIKVSVTAGKTFADGKGSITASLGYNQIGSIYAKDRKDQGLDLDAVDDYDGDPANYKLIHSQTAGLFSSYTPTGVFELPREGASSLLRTYDASGTLVPYSGALGFNRQGSRLLQVPLKQWNFATYGSYEFNEKARLFTEVNFVSSKLTSNIEATPLGSDQIYGAFAFCDTGVCQSGVPILSAVVPEAVRNAARAANPGVSDDNLVVGFRRRLTEVGDRGNDIDRQTFRFVAGIEGDINPAHHYELSINYGRTDDEQTSSGDIDAVRFRNALDAVVVNGSAVCRDPAARAAGCVPINIFGAGSITPQAADYVRVPTSRDAFVEQLVVNGFLRGDLFELPAGTVGYAAGAEYRRERAADVPDLLTQTGQTSGNATPPTRGRFDVTELFGELRVPILADLPFVQSLDLNLAGRYSNYSTVGVTEAWAASVEYQPASWLKLRGQFARAVRAPNISELYSPASQDFPTVNDPCAGVTRTAGGQAAFFNTRTNIGDPSAVLGSGVNAATVGNAVATACLADPAVAARVARDGGFALTQIEQQGVTGFDGGNANLRAEKGDSYTVGLLINPKGMGFLDNLSLSVDYYVIKIKDRIATISEDKLLTGCYGPAGFNTGNAFCSAVGRFGSGPSVGALNFVNQVNDNFAETDTRGWDVQVSYRQDLNDLGFLDGLYGGEKGALTMSLAYGYLEKLQTTPFKGADRADFIYDAGTVGAPTNEWTLDLLYRRGPLQLAWNTQFIGDVVVTKDVNDFYYNVPLSSKTFHNAQVRYDVTEKASIYAGVDNIFDNYQFVGGTSGLVPGQTTGWTTYPDVYDAVGRRFYAGARMRF